MQRDSDRVAPVFEKGYPSFEAVNNINDKDSNQERYHNYILRKLKEERHINTALDSTKEKTSGNN